MITEADTRRNYIPPKFCDGGWTNEQISEEKSFTATLTEIFFQKIKR